MTMILKKGILFLCFTSLVFTFESCNDTDDPVVIDDETIIDPNDCLFEELNSSYITCLEELNESTLDVVTWNLEYFPSNGNTTLGLLEDIIPNMNADIIALQEINNIEDFDLLVENLDGWEGEAIDLSGSLDFAYLYKTCEIEVLEAPSIALSGMVEPRPTGKIKIKHKNNGMEVTMFTIHLKCCGVTGSNEANRREAASKALQEHINTNLADEKVIVLGDWNDDLYDGPFDNFNTDEGFAFADDAIATGPDTEWSFPGWPSHLDHILISSELFNSFTEAETINLEGKSVV